MTTGAPFWPQAKRALLAAYRPLAPTLRTLGVDAKGRYELAYWKVALRREGVLRNDWYERVYTDQLGLPASHYVGKRILDIGCGPRGSLEWAAGASRRVGLDPLVSKYRSLGIDRHAMEYVEGRSEDMPFPDASFDIVSSINSLDHVDDLDQTLAEIRRVVAPGGELIVIVHIHSRPTIAEPVSVPWDLANRMADAFDVLDERHLELSPTGTSALRAVDSQIPFDHDDPTDRYGALTLRMQLR